MKRYYATLIMVLAAGIFIGCNDQPTVVDVPNDTLYINGEPKINLVKNGQFNIWESRLPSGWDYLKHFSFNISKANWGKEDNPALAFTLTRSDPVAVFQSVSVKKEKFYKATVRVWYENRNWDFGGLEIWNDSGTRILGFHKFSRGEDKTFKKLLSTKFHAGMNQSIQVRLNYDGREGTLLFDDVQLIEVSSTPGHFDTPFAEALYSRIPLKTFDSLYYHENVLTICSYLNSILVKPYIELISLKGPERGTQLNSLEEARKSELAFILKFLPESDLAAYLKEPIGDSGNEHPKKLTIASEIILTQFNIPAKQITMQRNKRGIHQFFEYWHPFKEKWILIDPYYGVCYQDDDNNLIGYEELMVLMENQEVTEKNLVKANVNATYYDIDVIRSAWNSTLDFFLLKDLRMSFAH